MHDLDPILQVELLKWREATRVAEEQGRPADERNLIRDRTIGAFVRTDLDDATLEGLGLKIRSRIGPLVLGEVALRDAERLAAAPGVVAVSPSQPMKPQLDDSVPQIRAPSVWNGTPSYKGRNVIVGMIDTGVDIFHDSFRLADRSKTRILHIWDQAGPGTSGPGGVGVEYNSGQIEAALAIDVANPGTATFPHNDGTDGHGTHVISTAAGDGSPVDTCDFPFTFVGVAPEANIIVVALGGATPEQAQLNMISGLQYIFDHATTINRAAIVNVSLGWNLGPRDGTDPADVAIDNLLTPPGQPALPGRAIVVAAGNEGQKRRHARKPIDSIGAVRFDFDIAPVEGNPRDVAPDRIDVWFDGAATLALTIDGPPTGGVVSQVIPAAGGIFPISNNSVTVSAAAAMPNGQNFIRIEIAGSAATPLVSMGRWTFRFTETSGHAATIDIWIERADTDIYPQFVVGDAIRDNTIMIPGTCQSVITVGSYAPDRGEAFDFKLSDFSSWGLQLGAVPAGRRLKPDVVGPGEEIMAASSGKARHPPPCCECCNYLHVDMQGTSMAAPHVAGVVALMFERNRNLTFDEVRAHIQVAASRDFIPVADVPTLLPLDHGGGGIGSPGDPDFKQIFQNNRWGSGRLDAKVAVETVLLLGGGGGGGGGGTIDSADPEPERFAPRVGSGIWNEQSSAHPAFQLIAALVSTHVDEVRRLIDANKRIAVVWRRGGGPAILRYLLQRPPDAPMILPAAVAEFSSSALIDRLMKLFERFGSEPLRADIARWRDFLLAAPGSDLDELDARLKEIAS